MFDCYRFLVVKVVKEKTCIYFHVRPRRKTAVCTNCNIRSKHRYGFHPKREIQNGTMLGKSCVLVFRPRRFLCKFCKRIFVEDLGFIAKRQRVTPKHKKEVVLNLSDRSFLSGTRKYNVSYHTQRKWLKEIVSSSVFDFSKEEKEATAFVLGIDEVSFSGHKMLTTVGNITKHRLKGVMTSKNKTELKKLLRSLTPSVKSLISEVVIDMCDLYLFAVQEILPKASIVVDHFHVIQDANRRLDEERRLLQDIFKKPIKRYILTKNKEDLKYWQVLELENIMKNYPELKMYWETKERLRTMYKIKTKEEVEEKLRLVISTLSSTDDGELITWGNTLSRWKEYILNYFNNKSTNGYMEGMHNKMKLIKRISFGFKNKEVFIQKVMLSVLITTLLLQPLFT